ncbi:hypothetical protein WJS89_03475 [Sphingomicrobium sp. XHP0235]|uniref:hypothetical protein n=1 Tax=Sphingomicrobium aquimarinum TaxID=3133971 RepID=UPI0031FEF89C
MSDTKDNSRLEKDPKPESYSEKARIEAMDSDNFDPVKYQEKGQGKPEKGLKANLEEEE